MPSPQLNATQLTKIAQLSQTSQQPVSFLHAPTSIMYTHGREAMRFSTTYQFYKQTPQQLQKWLTPLAYKDLFPRQIKRWCYLYSESGQDADIQVNVGLGVINIPFAFKLHFNHPNTTENNSYANGGDLRFIKGQMGFTELNQGAFIKVMTTNMKIRWHLYGTQGNAKPAIS